MISVEGWI